MKRSKDSDNDDAPSGKRTKGAAAPPAPAPTAPPAPVLAPQPRPALHPAARTGEGPYCTWCGRLQSEHRQEGPIPPSGPQARWEQLSDYTNTVRTPQGIWLAVRTTVHSYNQTPQQPPPRTQPPQPPPSQPPSQPPPQAQLVPDQGVATRVDPTK